MQLSVIPRTPFLEEEEIVFFCMRYSYHILTKRVLIWFIHWNIVIRWNLFTNHKGSGGYLHEFKQWDVLYKMFLVRKLMWKRHVANNCIDIQMTATIRQKEFANNNSSHTVCISFTNPLMSNRNVLNLQRFLFDKQRKVFLLTAKIHQVLIVLHEILTFFRTRILLNQDMRVQLL